LCLPMGLPACHLAWSSASSPSFLPSLLPLFNFPSFPASSSLLHCFFPSLLPSSFFLPSLLPSFLLSFLSSFSPFFLPTVASLLLLSSFRRRPCAAPPPPLLRAVALQPRPDLPPIPNQPQVPLFDISGSASLLSDSVAVRTARLILNVSTRGQAETRSIMGPAHSPVAQIPRAKAVDVGTVLLSTQRSSALARLLARKSGRRTPLISRALA